MAAVREIRYGVIGCGLMGREFASAALRWRHLLDLDFAPKIVAVCDPNAAAMTWFQESVPDVRLATTDYQDLLADSGVDAVYCAVPHHLHEAIYRDTLRAGKHLLGEKPFGIDQPANERIQAEIAAHPDVLVRCSSEFPFFPGAQQIVRQIAGDAFGTILEVRAGFLHSSDMDPQKPINWKRRIATNGAYGCTGDLGMHVLHIPLRAGWMPENVRAILSNIVPERPDGQGGMAVCDTWDNATLFTEVRTAGQRFPLTLETKRIAPGEMNTWYLQVHGTRLSAEFSTKFPKTLRTLSYAPGARQAWQVADIGYESCYPAITGGIFEFGFSDAILQMWAAFCDEVANGPSGMRQPFRCVTPEETGLCHQVLTAALQSHKQQQAVALS